jgi:subtilase family serine protease
MPEYHKWMAAEEFGQKFSLAPEDVQTIDTWLSSKGFKTNTIGVTLIDFSGTAAQVRNAFKTEIHYLDVRGFRHIANMQNPRISTALAPAVGGIVSLNDFRPRSLGRVY